MNYYMVQHECGEIFNFSFILHLNLAVLCELLLWKFDRIFHYFMNFQVGRHLNYQSNLFSSISKLYVSLNVLSEF